MFAVMVSVTTVSGTLAAWSLGVFVLATLILGTLTAPVHVRKLAGAVAVSLVLAGGLVLPQIIIRCPEWWIGCW